MEDVVAHDGLPFSDRALLEVVRGPSRLAWWKLRHDEMLATLLPAIEHLAPFREKRVRVYLVRPHSTPPSSLDVFVDTFHCRTLGTACQLSSVMFSSLLRDIVGIHSPGSFYRTDPRSSLTSLWCIIRTMRNLADPEPNGHKKKNLPATTDGPRPLTPVQIHCAMLLGQGFSIPQVAARMVDYIIQKSNRDPAYRKKLARNRLRKWRKRPEFRDKQWEAAVTALDNSTPAILKGLAKKAIAGRVDATKLALEITERHTPKGEPMAANVQVVFTGLPRPEADVELDEDDILDEEDG